MEGVFSRMDARMPGCQDARTYLVPQIIVLMAQPCPPREDK